MGVETEIERRGGERAYELTFSYAPLFWMKIIPHATLVVLESIEYRILRPSLLAVLSGKPYHTRQHVQRSDVFEHSYTMGSEDETTRICRP